jgi:hypothetical protein
MVAAIRNNNIFSERFPNKLIAKNAPKTVGNKIFLIKSHRKKFLYTKTLERLLVNWTEPWSGIKIAGEKNCANATSIINPPPILKTEVSKEVKNDSIIKKVTSSRDIQE